MDPNEIQGDRIVEDVLDHWPEAIPVFLKHGMSCVGCTMACFETLASAAEIYHLPLDQFLAELRELD